MVDLHGVGGALLEQLLYAAAFHILHERLLGGRDVVPFRRFVAPEPHQRGVLIVGKGRGVLLEAAVQRQRAGDGVEFPARVAEGVELRDVGSLVGEVQIPVVFHIGEEELTAGDAGILVLQSGLPGGVGLEPGQLGVIVGFVGIDHRLVVDADAIRFRIAGGPLRRGVVHPFEETGFVVIIHGEAPDLHAGAGIPRIDCRQLFSVGGAAQVYGIAEQRRGLRCVQSVRVFGQVRVGEDVGLPAVLGRFHGALVQDGIEQHLSRDDGGIEGLGQGGGEDAVGLLRAVDRCDGAVGQVVDEGHLGRLAGVAVHGLPQPVGVLEGGDELYVVHGAVEDIAAAHVQLVFVHKAFIKGHAAVAPLGPAHAEARQLRAVGVVEDVEVLGSGVVGAGGEDMGGCIFAVRVRQGQLRAPVAVTVGLHGADDRAVVKHVHPLVGLGHALEEDLVRADIAGKRGQHGAGAAHHGAADELAVFAIHPAAAAIGHVGVDADGHIPLQVAGLAVEGDVAGQLHLLRQGDDVVTRARDPPVGRVVGLAVHHQILQGRAVGPAHVLVLRVDHDGALQFAVLQIVVQGHHAGEAHQLVGGGEAPLLRPEGGVGLRDVGGVGALQLVRRIGVQLHHLVLCQGDGPAVEVKIRRQVVQGAVPGEEAGGVGRHQHQGEAAGALGGHAGEELIVGP